MRLPASNKKIVCFSRWNRKPYAIFASLKICVVIGHLRKNTADSSLTKTGKMGFILYGDRQSPVGGNVPGEDDSGPPLLPPLGTLRAFQRIGLLCMQSVEGCGRSEACFVPSGLHRNLKLQKGRMGRCFSSVLSAFYINKIYADR